MILFSILDYAGRMTILDGKSRAGTRGEPAPYTLKASYKGNNVMSKDLWKLGNEYNIGDIVYTGAPHLVVGVIADGDGYGLVNFRYQVAPIKSFDPKLELKKRIDADKTAVKAPWEIQPFTKAHQEALNKSLARIANARRELDAAVSSYDALKAMSP